MRKQRLAVHCFCSIFDRQIAVNSADSRGYTGELSLERMKIIGDTPAEHPLPPFPIRTRTIESFLFPLSAIDSIPESSDRGIACLIWPLLNRWNNNDFRIFLLSSDSIHRYFSFFFGDIKYIYMNEGISIGSNVTYFLLIFHRKFIYLTFDTLHLANFISLSRYPMNALLILIALYFLSPRRNKI